MDAQTIETLADRLIAAEESREPVEVLTIDHPDLTVEDGYRVQLAIADKRSGARGPGSRQENRPHQPGESGSLWRTRTGLRAAHGPRRLYGRERRSTWRR